jgi:hypothetical protein
MTGTPTPNGPTDAYGMAKLVNNAFGESFTSFKERVLYKAGMWKWVPKPGAHAEALRLLQPSVRFAIDDCVDLPPSTTQQREVELSPEQAKAYKALKTDLILSVQGGKQITAANEAVLRLKLIQIACGAVYGVDREVHLVDCQPPGADRAHSNCLCPVDISLKPVKQGAEKLHARRNQRPSFDEREKSGVRGFSVGQRP